MHSEIFGVTISAINETLPNIYIFPQNPFLYYTFRFIYVTRPSFRYKGCFPPFPSIFLSKDEGADKYEHFL
jgi:hypothetical protein